MGKTGNSKRRRIVLVAAAAILLLGVVAIAAIPLLVDAERFRPTVEEALSSALGAEVEIGALDFSVLRGLVLAAEPVTVRTDDEALDARVESIEVSAALWPLLRGELSIREVAVVAPELTLTMPPGHEGLLPPLPIPANAPSDTAEGSSGVDVSIERVVLSGGSLTMRDLRTDPPRTLELEKLSAVIEPAAGRFDGSAHLGGGEGRFEFRGDIGDAPNVTLDLGAVRVDPLVRWFGDDVVKPGGVIEGVVEIDGAGSIAADLVADGMMLLAGREPLPRAGVKALVTSGAKGAYLEHLAIDAGGVTLNGEGPLAPALDLQIDLLEADVDRIVEVSRAMIPVPLEIEGPGRASASVFLERPEAGPFLATARGRLSAATTRLAAELPPVEQLDSTFVLGEDGILSIDIGSATSGGGALEGEVRVVPAASPERIEVRGKLADALLPELLRGFSAEAADQIEGSASLDAGLLLDPNATDAGPRALKGAIDLDVRGAGLPTWNLEKALADSIAQRAGALGKLLRRGSGGETGDGSDGTDLFDRLTTRVDMSSYPWQLQRIRMTSSKLDATGEGTFDPEGGALTLDLVAKLSKDETAALVQRYPLTRVGVAQDGRFTLPLTIDGPMGAPKVSVDVAGMLRGGGSPGNSGEAELQSAGEKALEKKASELLGGLLGGDDD